MGMALVTVCQSLQNGEHWKGTLVETHGKILILHGSYLLCVWLKFWIWQVLECSSLRLGECKSLFSSFSFLISPSSSCACIHFSYQTLTTNEDRWSQQQKPVSRFRNQGLKFHILQTSFVSCILMFIIWALALLSLKFLNEGSVWIQGAPWHSLGPLWGDYWLEVTTE